MQKIILTNKIIRRLPKNAICSVFYLDSVQHFSRGEATLVNQYNKARHIGHITQVYSKTTCQLTQDEVSMGGYRSVQELTYELAMRYTRLIRDDDTITIVTLKVDSADAAQEPVELGESKQELNSESKQELSKFDLAV